MCHICLADPSGKVRARIEETCEGQITEAPRGASGFGYDPVFVAAPHLSEREPPTFAELTAEQKDQVSHRGKAMRKLVAFLKRHLPSDAGP